jgi:hypothetical protein
MPVAAARTATIGAVRVVAARAPTARAAPAPSVAALGRAQLLTTPGGMADVFQAVGLQPGATRVGEGSDVYTRGGDPAETPLYVDGGRLVAATRFEGLNGGLFGALDPSVLRAVRFSSGGFPARFGNALSGILDPETDGRPREVRARLGLNTVQAAGTARAPLGPRTGAWASVRGSDASLMLGMHDRRADFAGAPWSMEGIGAVVHEPRPGTELRAVAMVERDASARVVATGGWEAPFRATGDTRFLVLAGRTLARTAPVVVKGNLTVTDRATGMRFGVLARDRRDAVALARVDAEWQPRAALTLRGGIEGGRSGRRESGRVPLTPLLGPGAPSAPLAATASDASQLGGYAEATLALSDALVAEGGLRADRLPGEPAVTVDPRAALAWHAGRWTARVGGGGYHQGRWRAAAPVPNPGVPAGVPTRATHLVGAVEHAGALTWKLEAFEKRYGDYALPLGGAAGAGAALGPAIAAGRARGLDLLVRPAAARRVTGWLGYSFLDARLDLVGGRRVRSPLDVTHTVTGVATLDVGHGWSLGTTARYGTGVPVTPVLGGTAAPGGAWAVPAYGATLGARLPDYRRLDARLTRAVATRAGLLNAYVEGINVLDRANVAGYTYDATYRERRALHGFFAARTLIVGAELQRR